MKKIVALCLSFILSVTILPLSAFAQEPQEETPFKTNTFELAGKTIELKYLEEDGKVVYAEFDNHVVERKDNVIYMNGNKIATITTTYTNHVSNDIERTISPRSSWMWSTIGNDNDYLTTYTEERSDVYTEISYRLMDLSTFISIIIMIVPINELSRQLAQTILDFVTTVAVQYLSSKHLYYIQKTYPHRYLGLSYAKKVNLRFFLDSERTYEIPNTESTTYGSWG